MGRGQTDPRGRNMITALEIRNVEQLQDECLRERFNKGNSCKTVTLVALIAGVEAGLLIYEDWGTPESIVFEIFVLSEARGLGVGSWMLSQAELIATASGRESDRLTARSLDRDYQTDDALIAWYERHGYQRCEQEESVLRKALSTP